MQKLGMTREGVLRSNRACRGDLTDEVVYGLLREEWREPRSNVGSTKPPGFEEVGAANTLVRPAFIPCAWHRTCKCCKGIRPLR
jgi:hypothetical protein